MPIQDELCFVQFMHPGPEHRPDRQGFKAWNRGNHKRKFVENPGRCVLGQQQYEGPLRFWAEWEPESHVAEEFAEPVPHGPRYLYRPYYCLPASHTGLQNTDPFVFGGFFYTGCQQHRDGRPTQLRHLAPRSVILFGSRIDGKFALDTVFVVSDQPEAEDHDATNWKRLRQLVPPAYWDVTFRPWYEHETGRCGNGCANPVSAESFRLYWGATYDKQVNGMFSYFPCQPAEETPGGFCRPFITLPQVIKNTLGQGYKHNKQLGLTEQLVRQYWGDVRKQVESEGLWLGVDSKMPPRRSNMGVSR